MRTVTKHTPSTELKLSFCGAARQVTGSSHSIILPSGRKILLDYGLFQGKREEAALQNRSCELPVADYDAIILSHAHIDHSGRIPLFVKQGFKGKVFCTPVTQELSNYMLLDSAEIQMADARYFHRQHIPTKIPTEPLYDVDDVRKAMKLFVGKPYYEKFQVTEGVMCEFFDAGHVLGSAISVLTFQTRAGERRLVFTGDLGKPGSPIVRDPDQLEHADYLVSESTYGNRIHEGKKTLDEEVAKHIRETAERKGKIVIPAFALERTQELVYRLQRMLDKKMIPAMPMYVDSPMASEVTEVFRKHPEVYDQELKDYFEKSGTNPFSEGRIKYTGSVEESKHLNHMKGPMIIISASGMCEEGRIRHHLANTISEGNNVIMIVGYQAEETLGRKLVDGEKRVSIFGKDFEVRAKVVDFEGFSAHADRDDLDAFAKRLQGLRQIFLVHGEEDQQQAFAARLRGFSDAEVIIPSKGDEIELL